jgi:hypothetical protein
LFFEILADLPVVGAFGFDAFGAVVFSGARSARHHQAAVGLRASQIGPVR